jgi:hypothetical protein
MPSYNSLPCSLIFIFDCKDMQELLGLSSDLTLSRQCIVNNSTNVLAGLNSLFN